ncbi:MAG TPA: TRAP transporter small permease, partial [Egicoccus sp.]
RDGDPIGRWISRLNEVLHVAAILTLLGLLAWTVADIVGRSFFDRPMRGTVELTELAVVVLVYLGLARVESQDAHISVDLLYVRFGRRMQLGLRALALTLGVIVVGTMTWRLFDYAGQLAAGGYTTGILRLPLRPVALLGVAGAAMFGVTMAANLLLVLRALARGR